MSTSQKRPLAHHAAPTSSPLGSLAAGAGVPHGPVKGFQDPRQVPGCLASALPWEGVLEQSSKLERLPVCSVFVYTFPFLFMISLSIYLSLSLNMYVCICLPIYEHKYRYIDIYIYTYTCTYTYMDIDMYVYPWTEEPCEVQGSCQRAPLWLHRPASQLLHYNGRAHGPQPVGWSQGPAAADFGHGRHARDAAGHLGLQGG